MTSEREHPARRLFGEEQIAELRRVEPEDEPAEGAVALALAPREAAEPPGREIAGRETIGHRLRSFEPGLERDGDAGRKHRIEKRPGIAGEHPAVARVRARPEREVLFDAHRPLPARRREQSGHRRRLGNRPVEQRAVLQTLQRAGGRPRQHDADAHQVVGNRNHPEPSEVLARDDADVAGAASFSARDAGVVREHREVGEPRFVDSQIELAREQRAAARRVDDRLRAHGVGCRAALDALHRRR